MQTKTQSKSTAILTVPRTKEGARRFYDRISRVYGFLTNAFEGKSAELALSRLRIQEGESVMEIGFGTGQCLRRIAESVGQTGKASGIDISPGMLKVTKRRLEKTGLTGRIDLHCGDATILLYEDNSFDAAFMSFTLELFDTPEIPKVLQEIKSVLKPDGRLGAVSMSRESGHSTLLRIYEWAHNKWPEYVDCRPIYLEQALRDAGYKIESTEKLKLFSLPVEIVIASKPA